MVRAGKSFNWSCLFLHNRVRTLYCARIPFVEVDWRETKVYLTYIWICKNPGTWWNSEEDVTAVSYLYALINSSLHNQLKIKTYPTPISYHKSVKKISGLQVLDSNHEGCVILKMPIFKHVLSKRTISFAFPPHLVLHFDQSVQKMYFRYSS